MELLRARNAIKRAVYTLMQLINSAELQVVGSEIEKSAPFGPTTLRGIMDLLLTDPGGMPVILDLKWTKWHKYKRESLKDGTSVQLAAYSSLEMADTQKQPTAGYFMLRQSKLYHSADRPFPPYMHIAGPNLQTVWQRVSTEYTSITELLNTGTIPVTGLTEEPLQDRSSSRLARFATTERSAARRSYPFMSNFLNTIKIVGASAGTGKTTRLALEHLQFASTAIRINCRSIDHFYKQSGR